MTRQGTGERNNRILVVDDEADLRFLLESFLTNRGYEVRAVSSAGKAMDELSRVRFSVVVTDIRMPGQNGVDLAEWIARYAPGTEVIFMTGHASIESAARAVRVGASDYLLKPFSSLELVAATVERTIEKRRLEKNLKETTEALRRSRDGFSSIVESSGDGIFVVDARGFVRFANPTCERMLGLTAGEMLGGGFDDPLVPGTQQRVSIVQHDRRVGAAEARVHATRWEGERAVVVVLSDVTEREELQAELALSERLASMGMLAAGLAHEIKNPLTYLLYNLESVERELPDGAGGDLVQRLREAQHGARRICETTRDLGTFARSERETSCPADLRRAIESAASMASNEVRFRARLVTEFGDVPAVRASERRLTQVFLNLIVNAAHAIGEGDVERNQIRIRTFAEEEVVYAEVRDTGEGIDPEHLKDVFRPFFTTRSERNGVGLGLAISEKIITGYGGRIWVESTPGEGTRFVVRLPAAPSVEQRTGRRPTALPESRPPRPRRGRILVVDDEKGIRLAIRRVLGRWHDVVLAASASEAMVVLDEDQRFDVILCDLMMPQTTGMELYEWMTREHPDITPRIAFMTGGAFTPRAREFCERTELPLLDKPIETQCLLARLQELIEETRCS